MILRRPPQGLKMEGLCSELRVFPKRQILDSSKPKEFADDNFEFVKNGGKYLIMVENTVGKGEIARNEQFLLFPLRFSKDFYCRHVKSRYFGGKGYMPRG